MKLKNLLFLAIPFIGSFFNPLKANYWLQYSKSGNYHNYIYKIDDTKSLNDAGYQTEIFNFLATHSSRSDIYLDAIDNKMYFWTDYNSGSFESQYQVYDLTEGTHTYSTFYSNDVIPLFPGQLYSDEFANTFGTPSNGVNISEIQRNISSNNSSTSTNASNITSNDVDIASNTSNISNNDTDIASNASSISTNTSNISSNDTDISSLQSLISTKSGTTTTTRIGDSTQNILEIGPTNNPTTINQTGISVSGSNLIKKDSDGNIHIGKNSFVIGDDVLNGAHPIWAEDENDNKIPLNVYGSDLQINGVSVQDQIDTNATNISSNDSDIATNSTNISSNDTDIATNQTNIDTNATNISSNDSDIATNSTNISSNDTDIATNQTNIATNSTNISSNDTDIATNASNISSNDTDIATNASNISSNDTDIATNQTNIATNSTNISSNDTDIATNASNISSNDTDIATNASNISSNDADIANLQSTISTKSNGEIHIGSNSLVLKEEDGRQKMWATDSSGKSIPIDITNGSKLLIRGRDVEQSIDNVGALSAALTGLPTVPTDSPIACGLGTGTHGGNYAFSGGCASRVNEKLAFNAAASFVPGQEYQGVGNAFSARAGFVFKLGKLEKSKERIQEIKNSNSKIKKDILTLSKNKKKNAKDIEALNKQLKKQTELLASLEKDNQILKENNKLILSENEQLISRLEDLISRLEKIDKLAPTNFDISRK